MHIENLADVMEKGICELCTTVGDQLEWRSLREYQVVTTD